jgi:hypothetical protein
MKTKQKGFYRKKEMITYLRDHFKVLTTTQFYLLFFSDIKHGLIKAREVLRKMRCDKSLGLKVSRQDFNYDNYYYFDRKPYNPDHAIQRSWAMIYLINKYKKYHRFNNAEIEYVLGELQADGFLELKNFTNDKLLCWFIESDIVSSKNRFNKVIKYNNVKVSKVYKREKWSVNTDFFPDVLVVTDSDKRVDTLKKYVKNDNKAGMDFHVVSIGMIKKELGVG